MSREGMFATASFGLRCLVTSLGCDYLERTKGPIKITITKQKRRRNYHNLLLLCSRQEQETRNKGLRFETYWIKQCDFLQSSPRERCNWNQSIWIIKIKKSGQVFERLGPEYLGHAKKYHVFAFSMYCYKSVSLPVANPCM